MNDSRRAMVLFAIVLYCLSPTAFAQSREYKIKAEFLERFTRFIDWPAEQSQGSEAEKFRVCVFGENPFGNYLADLTGEIRIQGRRVAVTNFNESRAVKDCDLLFIARSESANLPAVLSSVAGKPILTVGDTDGFGQKGVMINFYKEGDFIRFEINQAAVQNSGLRFSSRLLKLGKLVD